METDGIDVAKLYFKAGTANEYGETMSSLPVMMVGAVIKCLPMVLNFVLDEASKVVD